MIEEVECCAIEDNLVDDYSHIVPNILYTAANIPGPGANLEDFNIQYTHHCACAQGSCCDDTCCCIKKYGMNYVNGRLLDSKFEGPVFECNSLCKCSYHTKCENRLVQFGPRKGLHVVETQTCKGLGLKTSSEILRGEFICEYAGEVVSVEEAKTRMAADSGKMNFIFILKEHVSDKILKTCIDPTAIGNIGRYINHSCDPNAVIIPVRIDNPIPKLCIFALKSIKKEEEITFDYGGCVQSQCTEAVNVQESKKVFKQRKLCLCGAKTCKKFLPFDDTLF